MFGSEASWVRSDPRGLGRHIAMESAGFEALGGRHTLAHGGRWAVTAAAVTERVLGWPGTWRPGGSALAMWPACLPWAPRFPSLLLALPINPAFCLKQPPSAEGSQAWLLGLATENLADAPKRSLVGGHSDSAISIFRCPGMLGGWRQQVKGYPKDARAL